MHPGIKIVQFSLFEPNVIINGHILINEYTKIYLFIFFFKGECQVDDECPLTEACEDYYCKNPCKPDTCQKEYFCKVIRHIPTCGLEYVPEEPEVETNNSYQFDYYVKINMNCK